MGTLKPTLVLAGLLSPLALGAHHSFLAFDSQREALVTIGDDGHERRRAPGKKGGQPMSDSNAGASGYRQSRRTFLGGVAGVGAGVAVSTRGSAQSTVTINDPGVVREIEVLFADYNHALTSNDVAALNGHFFDSPFTVRFGNGENLYGIEAIAAYRASVTRAPSVVREHAVITTYGADFATVAARNQAAGGRIGRTMQTWVRFAEGWRIVAAHVSSIEA